MKNEQFLQDKIGNIVRAPETIGSPIEDAMHAPGPQERIDSCAIRSQQHILAMYGIDVTEDILVQDAIKHNEYSLLDKKGTSIDNVGNLLERNGIDVNRYDNATVAHLISELGQGHKIIVGIDAYEAIADSLPDRIVEMQKDAVAERANHAVLVIDVDPRTLDIAIVDPADGQMHVVPVGRFVDAWQDSDCFMIATKESPEEFLNENEIELDRGGLNTMHDFEKNDLSMGHVAGVEPQNMEVNQPRLGSLGQVAGVSPNLGGLGHVAGVEPQSMEANQPRLGSLGQVAGVSPNLGGLGHVAGVEPQSMEANQPRLGSLGQVAGVSPNLGGLGHVAGVELEGLEVNQTRIGSLGQESGMDMNCDGILDTFALDTDGDGIPDAFAFDMNHDGAIDAFATPIDLNADGTPDLIGVDLDGDGIIDCTIDSDDFSSEY